MIKKRLYALFALILCVFMSFPVMADTLHSVSIRQVYLFKDILRVYADIEDIKGNSIESIKKTDTAGYLNQKKLTTNSVKKFYETGEGVADIFLVDISKSLNNAQMEQVKAAMQKWASEMKPNDRMAIITFGEEVNTILDYSNDPDAIQKAINSIANSGMKTKLYGAVNEGLNLSQRNDIDLPKRRDIILVTDGLNDSNGGVSMEDVSDRLKKTRIPIYCLWLEGRSGNEGESTMNTLSERSGGKKYNLGQNNINTVYDQVHNKIQNSFVIDLAYSDDEFLNGTSSNLELKVTADGKTPIASLDTYFSAPTEGSGMGQVISDTTLVTGTEQKDDGDSKTEEEKEKKDDKDDEEDEDGQEDNKVLFLVGIGIVFFVVIVAIILIILKLVKGKKEDERENSNHNYENSFDLDHTDYRYQGQNFNQNYSETAFIPHGYGGKAEQVEQTRQSKNNIWTSQEIVVKLLDTSTGKVKTAKIQNEYHIGRKADNDFVIDSPKVSGRHCILYIENGVVYVEDLGSTNGTKLNGNLVHEKKQLKTGDILVIANKTYQVEI